MKRNLLLTIALGAIGLTATAATHNIYVANYTDWGDDVTLYSWGAEGAEVLGAWPGAAPTAQETISNVKYEKFVIEGHDGESVNLIFNDNANDANQVDLASLTLDEENYYFATNGILINSYTDPSNPDVEFDMPDTYVYILDKTTWGSLYLYAWATDQAEVFGGWPGAAATETEVIAGETYKKVPFPGNGTITYNLIFNDNGENKVENGLTAISGTNVYVELTDTDATILPTPGVKTYNIYIEDQTTWGDLYLYAYVGAAPSIFGGWPGIHVADTETVDGIEYKVVKDVEETDVAQTFIVNNNNGSQLDVPGEYVINGNIFFTVTDTDVKTGIELVEADNVPAEYFNLQGVRIAEPATGIFICRKGSKITKVVK